MSAVVDSPEFAAHTRSLGIDAKSNTPHRLDVWFAKEMEKWAEIAKEANIKAE
jgi:tripartite-type tricarboxylate transporter receptor subunit TctC